MKTPSFWYRQHISVASMVLRPLSFAYANCAKAYENLRKRKAFAMPKTKVICIGNITMGGAGKTPLTMALYEAMQARGLSVAIVSRGYGGRLLGPVQVKPKKHATADVGDEPLMMATRGYNVWVGKSRKKTLRALGDRFDVVLLDDGYQNESVVKNKHILVLDGRFGLGNGLVFPAGPLRGYAGEAIKKADVLVIIGKDQSNFLSQYKKNIMKKTVLRADLKMQPTDIEQLKAQPLLAFAGIGLPEKFFTTLKDAGFDVQAEHGFSDHHMYEEAELLNMFSEHTGLVPVTTEKDFMRLPDSVKPRVLVAHVYLDMPHIEQFIDTIVKE